MNQEIEGIVTHPNFAHLTEKERGVTRSPDKIRLQIINPQTTEGVGELYRLSESCPNPSEDISDLSFRSGATELTELAEKLSNIPQSEEGLRGYIEAVRAAKASDISAEQIEALLAETTIIKDLIYLRESLIKYKDDSSLVEQNSRWIWRPQEKKLDKYIGADEHRLLMMSRLLGLVSFETVKKLREIKICVIGASVAASTIDMLASLGAENIDFYDAGIFDPSNTGKSPGGMGNFYNAGQSKALLLLEQIQGRNPYGNFNAHPGRVLLEGESPSCIYDSSLSEVVDGQELIIEVVDHARLKSGVREYMQTNAPNVPIVFIADVGADPFVGIEIPKDGNWFNQNLSNEDKDRMTPDGEMSGFESARAVYQMVDKDFPDDHRLQFMFAALGLVPYWSQLPGAARKSSAIATDLIISLLNDEVILGRNYHQKDAPNSLVKRFSDKSSETLRLFMDQLLDIKR